MTVVLPASRVKAVPRVRRLGIVHSSKLGGSIGARSLETTKPVLAASFFRVGGVSEWTVEPMFTRRRQQSSGFSRAVPESRRQGRGGTGAGWHISICRTQTRFC